MLDFLLTAIASILFVVDPLGAVPTYLVMTGIHVFSRVLGLILAAIAVQFVLDGLTDAGALPRHRVAATAPCSNDGLAPHPRGR